MTAGSGGRGRMVAVAHGTDKIELSMDELRSVAAYTTKRAEEVLLIFERADQTDARPREAIEAGRAFANGAKRTKLQRTSAVAAHRAAKEATTESARDAARAAGHAAAAAYLHPLARPTQVMHVLGAVAYAARAAELVAGDDPTWSRPAIALGWSGPLRRAILIRSPQIRPLITPKADRVDREAARQRVSCAGGAKMLGNGWRGRR